jgi:hypothetical protein
MSSSNSVGLSQDLNRFESDLPSSLTFYQVFRDVLVKWAYLPSEYIGTSSEKTIDYPIELGVRLSGTLKSTLLIRCQLEFGRLLAESALGDDANDEKGVDSLKELANLFCGHLLTSCWPTHSFDHFIPSNITRESWPKGALGVSSFLNVDNHPVEIRLWIEPGRSAKQEAR